MTYPYFLKEPESFEYIIEEDDGSRGLDAGGGGTTISAKVANIKDKILSFTPKTLISCLSKKKIFLFGSSLLIATLAAANFRTIANYYYNNKIRHYQKKYNKLNIDERIEKAGLDTSAIKEAENLLSNFEKKVQKESKKVYSTFDLAIKSKKSKIEKAKQNSYMFSEFNNALLESNCNLSEIKKIEENFFRWKEELFADNNTSYFFYTYVGGEPIFRIPALNELERRIEEEPERCRQENIKKKIERYDALYKSIEDDIYNFNISIAREKILNFNESINNEEWEVRSKYNIQLLNEKAKLAAFYTSNFDSLLKKSQKTDCKTVYKLKKSLEDIVAQVNKLDGNLSKKLLAYKSLQEAEKNIKNKIYICEYKPRFILKNGDIYYSKLPHSKVKLTTSGKISGFWPSPNVKRVLYMEEGQLYLINYDGTDKVNLPFEIYLTGYFPFFKTINLYDPRWISNTSFVCKYTESVFIIFNTNPTKVIVTINSKNKIVGLKSYNK